jgi:hypothetical protein
LPLEERPNEKGNAFQFPGKRKKERLILLPLSSLQEGKEQGESELLTFPSSAEYGKVKVESRVRNSGEERRVLAGARAESCIDLGKIYYLVAPHGCMLHRNRSSNLPTPLVPHHP